MRSQYSEKSPFTYLRQVEAAIMSCAKGLPYHEKPQSALMGVVFISGDNVFITPLDEVVEILTIRILASVPGVKPWLRGMATCRGELFPVTDLNGFLYQSLSSLTQDSRILVLKVKEEYSGILVDRVLGIQRIVEMNKIEKSKTWLPEVLPFITGAYITDNMELPIISCKSIIEHPRFRDVVLKEDEIMEAKE